MKVVKIERGEAHVNGENCQTLEVWRGDDESVPGLELIVIIPLDKNEQVVFQL